MKITSLLVLLLLTCESLSAASYDLVYSIQMGAFRSLAARESFIQRYHKLPLYCRKSSRNAFMVYYGVFQSRADARPHLADIPDQSLLALMWLS